MSLSASGNFIFFAHFHRVYCDILKKVLELEEVDEALVESKMAMETLKAEYIQVHLRSVHFSRFLRDVTDYGF